MEIVKKSHSFITARMALSSREQDLLSLIILKIKKEHDKSRFSMVEEEEIPTSFMFHFNELIEHFSITRQGLYVALDESTTSIMKRIIEIKNPKNETFEKISVCNYASFKDGILRITVSKEAALHILDYSKGFAAIDLKLLLMLKGGYDKRILELISRFNHEKEFTTSLGEFCLMVGTDFTKFERFDVFKNTVLIKPIKNIIKKSNGEWMPKEGYPMGFLLERKGRSYQKEDKITFKLMKRSKENVSKKENSIENRNMLIIDLLARQITSEQASTDEALLFLSLIDKENISYTEDMINLAKKLAG